MSYPNKLVFVDLETTGGRVNYDRIIEVGIVRVENNEVVDTYQTLINPEAYLSPFIEQMTGIRREELDDAPTFSEVKEDILERLGDCVFVAHNVRFDYGFLRNEFRRFGIPYTAKHFCTAKLSKLLYPEHRHHNLDALIERFGFSCERRHRAFDDARVLWDFYKALQTAIPGDTLLNALQVVMKTSTIPSDVPQEVFDDLPEAPGVYIFYGEGDLPLYIGKSVNIRDRVLSHFTSDYLHAREMSVCSQTKRIETIVTTGELGALLLESQLIKKMQPIYNRKLRQLQRLSLVVEAEDTAGYKQVKIIDAPSTDLFTVGKVLGIFRTKRQAREHLKELAREHSLCEKHLGLEKAYGSCFNYKLGKCNGACVGKDMPLAYNMRFAAAFAKHKLKDWPFKGPVVINESSHDRGRSEKFLVDRWCFLGSIATDEASEKQDQYDATFDLDTYNILVRYFKAPKNMRNVKIADNYMDRSFLPA